MGKSKTKIVVCREVYRCDTTQELMSYFNTIKPEEQVYHIAVSLPENSKNDTGIVAEIRFREIETK